MAEIDCAFYYYDFHRGWENESCRLLEASPDSGAPWERSFCRTCPVPRFLDGCGCRQPVMEARAVRRLFRTRVEITLAFCGEGLQELDEHTACPACCQDQV